MWISHLISDTEFGDFELEEDNLEDYEAERENLVRKSS